MKNLINLFQVFIVAIVLMDVWIALDRYESFTKNNKTHEKMPASQIATPERTTE